MKHTNHEKKQENKIASKSTIFRTILLVVIVLFCFNFNLSAFKVGAVSGPIWGQGTPGFIAIWKSNLPPPTVTLDASPASVRAGNPVTLTWTISGTATGCFATNDASDSAWNGSKAFSSSTHSQLTSVFSDVGIYTFTINCNNVGATLGDVSTEVEVTPAFTNGVCGPAAGIYPAGSTGYSGPYCSVGTSSASPAFPIANTSKSWSCIGDPADGLHNVSCTVFLTPATYTVTVTNPVIGGTVRSADTHILCGTTCTHTYNENDSVILTATPSSAAWRFVGWSGSCSGVGLCSLVVDGPKTVTAVFAPRTFDYHEF